MKDKAYIWLRNIGVVVIAAVFILVASLFTCDRIHTAGELARAERLEHYKSLGDPDGISDTLGGVLISGEDEADPDSDGLSNAEERELGTDLYHADTDRDGLPDSYEVNVSKTDPLRADTDSDGMLDGDELDLGLDPLLADSRGDGVRDSERTVQFAVDDVEVGVSLDIVGQGNIASTTIDVYQNPTFAEMPGVLGTVYNFGSRGKVERVTAQIHYEPSDLAAKGLQADDLTLYYFNEQSNELEAVPSSVDTASQILTAELTHFSRYVIGDKSAAVVNATTDVMFVIDNSVSMYSNEQMEAAGYTATGAVGNDTEFKRLTLTNRLIDRLDGRYRFGVGEFQGDYANLRKFTGDRAAAKKAVDGMNTNWSIEVDGTDITRALLGGIREFSADDNIHYMVLLTDGKDTSDTLEESQDAIIAQAKKLDVKICVIGLGSNTDAEILETIAESTGCDYYSASDSSALDEIYNLIGANINYNYVDTDGDGEVDGMIVADSGFITNRDGFSFENFTSNKSSQGHCYGMATFAMLRYIGKLVPELPARTNSKFMIGEGGRVEMQANGYDLRDTYFMTDGNLYDFKFTSPGLKLLLQDVQLPDDYRDRVEDGVWMIKQEYYDDMSHVGVDITLKDYVGEDEEFDKYQSAKLQINNDKLTKYAKRDESALLDAIWRYFILQMSGKTTYFSGDPDKTYDSLVSYLDSGVPIVMGMHNSDTSHAVNAVRLIQDLEDPDLFKIEIYDNNDPGVPKYITLRRKKYNKIAIDFMAWTNDYSYSAKYDTNDDGAPDEIKLGIMETEVK